MLYYHSMKSFQDNRTSRKILESKPFLLLLGILVFAFGWNIFGFWGKMEETKKNKEMAQAKVAELQAQKDKLSGDIAKLKTDEGVEANIREKFGLVKPGEQMIVVVDDKTPPPAAEKPSIGLWGWMKSLFK